MKTVFLGDSITQGFIELKKHTEVINMGISGNRTIDVIERLNEVMDVDPEQLFLMIGINDIMTNHHIWFTDFPISIETTYTFIVRYLMNNLNLDHLFLLSILPVRSITVFEKELEEKINQDIDRLNAYIENLAMEYRLSYIDLNREFKDAQNLLKSEYTTDGVHLSKAGYDCFYENIKKFLI